MAVPRLVALVALALCFVAGYLLASWWWSSARDTSPLAQIRARVDYVNGLQENLKGQEAASEEVRAEFKALVEQCRTALRDRADEND
jgi:HAMP domain-containing protein